MKISRFLFAAALLPLASLSVAACGGNGGTGGSSSGTTQSSSSGATGGSGGSGGSGATGGGGSGGSGGSVPSTSFDCTAPSGAVPPLKLTELASGLDRPLFITASIGDDDRLFIVEGGGVIKILKAGAVSAEPFLDISSKVHQPSGGDERGLLGLAFHPDYVKNGRFFVYYTDDATNNQVVAEYARGASADAADPTEVARLLDLQDPESNHNGGMLAFGPDGFLYIGLGDGGGAGDQHGTFGNGQNLGTLWGKIARIDIDSATKPYGIPAGNITSVPAGNPTTDPVKQEIWDYGLRNPWRFSFDGCTDDLYIGDVGQNAWEEVDVEPAGQGNKNYGWRSMEGTHCFDQNLGCENVEGYTPPVLDYSHSEGCSITGGYVYRSSAIPSLRGTYFFGDYCSGKIWTITWKNGQTTPRVDTNLTGVSSVLVSFGQDNLGNVYVVGIDGKVYRIDAQ